MNKKLTAKVQKLTPVLPERASAFSLCVVIEPEEKKQILEKGAIYSVFELSGDNPFDVAVLSKLIHDVLNDSYYSSDSVSPIQSLEKALVDIKDKIGSLPNGGSLLRDSKIEFNVLAGVLWGNVLYVVQQGDAESFLMRSGEVRPIQSVGEGNFSASSGVVQDEDVVIFCTKSFGDKYPPKKLLTLAMSDKDLITTQTCILLKFIVDKNFTEDEFVDLSPVSTTKKEKIENFVESLVKKVAAPQHTKPTEDTLISAFKNNELKGSISAVELVKSAKQKSATKDKDQKLSKPSGSALKFIALGVVVAGLMLVGFYFLFFKKPVVNNTNKEVVVETKQPEVPVEEKPIVNSVAEDAKNKTTRVTVANVLYDLKITDSNVNPSRLLNFKNTLIAVDAANGKVYSSPKTSVKFTAINQTFTGLKYAAVDETGKLTFSDAKGFNVYDFSTDKMTASYASSDNTAPIGVYANFIYSFSGSKLVKYIKAGEKLSVATWGENADFNGAKDIVVAYNVYALTSDGKIVSYTSGNKNKFEITGIDKPLNSISQFYTDVDYKNIYIADKGNNRVVVVTKEGAFVKQFRYTEDSEWGDLRSITVSADEKRLYILNGSKIFEVSL